MHCLNTLCFPHYAGDGLGNFQAEILLFPLHPPQLPPTKKRKKEQKKKEKRKQSPTFCPNHTFSRGRGLSWWLNQGWGRGDCGSGSRRLQSAARFKSKGGERVRSNKHQSKCIISPKLENHSWLHSTNNSKGNTKDSILLSFLSCLLVYVVILLLNEWREMWSYVNNYQNWLPNTPLIMRSSNQL